MHHFALGVAISLTVALAVDLLLTPIAPLHRVDLDPGIWLPLAGVAAVGFLIQTGFEELLFRGYLAQDVASRTARTVLIIGLPALAFASPHWGNLATYGNTPSQLTLPAHGRRLRLGRLVLRQPVAALRAALGQQHLRNLADHHHR